MADIVQNVKLKGDSTSLQNASVAGGKAMTAAFAAGQIAASAALKVIGAVVDSMKEGIKFAVDYDKSQQKLIASLQAAGRPVEKNVELINQLSSEIQELTNVSDEVVRDMFSQAVAFGKSTAEADKLVRASFALSNAMGTDVKTAMKELMTTETGLLGRTVKMVDGVRDLSKAQLENGEATDLVIEKMGALVDVGSRGVSGSIATMSNAWDDLREELGKVVIQSDAITTSLEGMTFFLKTATREMNAFGIASSVFLNLPFARAVQEMFGTGADIGQLNILLQQQEEAQKLINKRRLEIEEDIKKTQDALAGRFDFGDKGIGGFEIKAPKVKKPEIDFSEFAPTTGAFQAGQEEVLAATLKADEARFEARKELFESLEQRASEGREAIESANAERRITAQNDVHETLLSGEQFFQDQRNSIISLGVGTATSLFTKALFDLAEGTEINGKQIARNFMGMVGQQVMADGIKNIAIGTAAIAGIGILPAGVQGFGLVKAGLYEVGVGTALLAGRLKLGASPSGGGGGGGGSTGGGASDFAAGAVRAPGGGGGAGGAPPVINLTFHGPTTKAEVGLALREAMAEADALGV